VLIRLLRRTVGYVNEEGRLYSDKSAAEVVSDVDGNDEVGWWSLQTRAPTVSDAARAAKVTRPDLAQHEPCNSLDHARLSHLHKLFTSRAETLSPDFEYSSLCSMRRLTVAHLHRTNGANGHNFYLCRARGESACIPAEAEQ